METANRLATAALPPGAEVGLWRLVARRGCGNSGAVYRAVRIGREVEGPVRMLSVEARGSAGELAEAL